MQSFTINIVPNQQLFIDEIGPNLTYTPPSINWIYTILLLNLLTNTAHYLSFRGRVILDYLPVTVPGIYVWIILFGRTSKMIERIERKSFTRQIKLAELGIVVSKMYFTVVRRSLYIPPEIKYKILVRLSLSQLTRLCHSGIYRDKSFMIAVMRKYLVSDPAKANVWYDRLGGDIRAFTTLLARVMRIIKKAYKMTTEQYYEIMEFDLLLSWLGRSKHCYLVGVCIRADEPLLDELIGYYDQYNLEQLFRIYDFINRHGESPKLIARMTDKTFDDLFDRAIKSTERKTFDYLLNYVPENEIQYWKDIYDNYTEVREYIDPWVKKVYPITLE